MPCYDSRDADDRQQNQAEVDRLTRLLCEAANVVSGAKPSRELLDWWIHHQQIDALRGISDAGAPKR